LRRHRSRAPTSHRRGDCFAGPRRRIRLASSTNSPGVVDEFAWPRRRIRLASSTNSPGLVDEFAWPRRRIRLASSTKFAWKPGVVDEYTG
jgi:hypothetical protein